MTRSSTLPNGATLKQFNFARAVFEGRYDNNSKAYRAVYDAEGMCDNAVAREASLLLKHPKVSQIIDKLTEDALLATQATVERKKALLMKVAEYGISIEVKSQGGRGQEDQHNDEIEVRQVDPKATVSAIKELNLMDGHHAAVRAKLEVGATVKVTAGDIVADNAFSMAEMEKALEYNLSGGLSEMDAVNRVLSEREKQKAAAIDGELVDDPWK